MIANSNGAFALSLRTIDIYPGFPADDLYLFRLYSVMAQAILWATIGLCFAPMASRLLGSDTSVPQQSADHA